MKQILTIVACLLLALTIKANENQKFQAQVDSARSFYDKKEYQKAIDSYLIIKNKGFQSAELYYNLGNAYYKSGKLGPAIYYYELALNLNPNDEDTKFNLHLANSKTIDKIEVKENFFFASIKSGIISAQSTSGWARLCIASNILGFLLLISFVSFSNVILKRISFWLGICSILGSVLFFSAGKIESNQQNNHSHAIILEPSIKVLTGPTNESELKFNLHEGTKVKVLKSEGNWTSVQLANGNEGWLETKALGFI